MRRLDNVFVGEKEETTQCFFVNCLNFPLCSYGLQNCKQKQAYSGNSIITEMKFIYRLASPVNVFLCVVCLFTYLF